MKAARLVISACVVLVLLFPARSSYAVTPSGREEWLDRWQPEPEHAQVPMESIRHREMDITGKWWSPHSIGHAVSWLAIGSGGGSSYRVIVKTSGCFELRFERTGKYADGVLTLNRPAEDALARVYRKLYAVRIAGEEYLLPSTSIGEVEATISKDGTRALDPYMLRSRLFVRKPTQQLPISTRPLPPAVVVVAVCAGAGLVVFILLTTFSGQSLASATGSPKIPTGYRRKPWDELTNSPQF